jgi:outer membrane protein assembly factor BamB
VAVTKNAVLVAADDNLTALDLNSGRRLWSQPLPMPPVPWGIAVDRTGHIVLTLQDGQLIAFAPAR